MRAQSGGGPAGDRRPESATARSLKLTIRIPPQAGPVTPDALPWAVERIRAGRIERGAALPRYGSPEWEALPADSAARLAAVVVAAEAWRIDSIYALADLELERLGQITEVEIAADREFATQAAAIRRMANSPTHAELQRRRSVISGPRPGDYPGRAS